MKVAAVTITYNRLALTKKTVESFYDKTSVDYHLFIDNGSTDGTQEYLKEYDHILLEKNYGIASAFRQAVEKLSSYDFILKLDNDVETVTPDIINKMLKFYELNGINYVCSPVDLCLDKAYSPAVFGQTVMKGYNVRFTTHTGGAFQLIPYSICKRLCLEFKHLQCGDYMIAKYFRRHAYRPTYLLDLEMQHIGINQSTPIKEYVL
jgi:glycosyltransferase involved in cell wall biosynthesis